MTSAIFDKVALLSYLIALFRLLRTQMTTISAVTHLCASLLSPNFSVQIFFRVWIYILLTQFCTHYLGEYYDRHSDRLNRNATVFTGGSRQIHLGAVPQNHVLHLGHVLTVLSATAALTLVPAPSRGLALTITFLAYSYSAPPLLLNHRRLGELDATLITSVLVPLLSICAQQASPPLPLFLQLVIPPTLCKFALFLTLNIADRRADHAASKITLAVHLGRRGGARLHYFLTVLAYLAATVIAIFDAQRAGVLPALRLLTLVLASSPLGLSFGLLWWKPFLRRPLLDIRLPLIAFFAWRTFGKVISKRRDAVKSLKTLKATSESGSAPPLNRAGFAMASSSSRDCDVTIIGGGIAGLTAAASLIQQGLKVRVLERRSSATEADSGADLALWPGAISLLKMLGVERSFFDKTCFPLSTVLMCNMDFDRMGKQDAAALLKRIDMEEVTRESGESFVLVPRQSLVKAIRALVPEEVVEYGANVERIVESEDEDMTVVIYSKTDDDGTNSSHRICSRVAIGADGARSRTRKHVAGNNVPELRYCGEVCYRGVLQLRQLDDETRDRVEELFPDAADARTMRICYGAGLRSSFGYMSADGEVAYWWVKVITSEAPVNKGKIENCSWPEPLKTLHDVTADDAFYLNAIEDSEELSTWSSPRVALIGDAAHVVSPNMGQGACLAIEDAVALSTQLATYWHEADGHVEAFYEYEMMRKSFVGAIVRDTRKQLKVGQLQAWPAVALRNLLLRIVPATVLQKTLKQSIFDVSAVQEQFRSRKVA
ncbi:FAD-dependent urate hydroxylase [Gracilariopsis chorda]|uniref:FAD-dependent urate hydroxylase n=1 Tax=Gracilariopsis chorda TaxID=448386 RepID=A0A2V3J5W0_9FLOR|nr:FAD-dependent urate hydroxylase [Gracilariopsis chorda]|eukprot:PXF49764.1 FAD-dependent urate hydroxylase [Gracilariopsis chorda]